MIEFGVDLPHADKALERAEAAGLAVDGKSTNVAGVRLAFA
jgi:hypothetical protein